MDSLPNEEIKKWMAWFAVKGELEEEARLQYRADQTAHDAANHPRR